MPFTFDDIRHRLRLVASIITALVATAGGVAALTAYSDLAPATRGYAKDVAKIEVDSALMVATARMGNLQRESGETRLQLNRLRLEGLRATKWALTEQLKAAPDPQWRRLIQQRLDQIDDDLRDVGEERDRLKIPSP